MHWRVESAFRKNPEATIEAFVRAFRPHEPVRLIVKVLNDGTDQELICHLRDLAGSSRVSFIYSALSNQERYRLLASIDSFVSLHRAEGLGLSIAEAMAYGKPVVVTNWSGNTDFTDTSNAALVEYDIITTDRRYGPYPAGTRWAEPRIDQAASQMRRIVDDPDWRQQLATAAEATVIDRFSVANVGRAMASRLERLYVSGLLSHRQAIVARIFEASSLSRPVSFIDLLRNFILHPGYYVSRLPRLHEHLRTHGVAGLYNKVIAASERKIQ